MKWDELTNRTLYCRCSPRLVNNPGYIDQENDYINSMLVNNQSRVLHRYISDSFKRKHSFQGRLKTMVSFAGVVLRRVLLRKPRHYILFKTGISIPSACMWWRTLALGRQRSRSFLSPFLKAVQRCRPWVAAFTHDFQDWAYSIIHIHFFYLYMYIYGWWNWAGQELCWFCL